VEDWAEIRRLHRAEGVSISEVARRLGLARNTVKAALRSERPPRYERLPRGSLADAVEPAVRALLVEFPRMPATVIAERIGWPYSMTTLKDRLRQIRPEYLGVDPVDRIVYEPGEITQCDLWFPDTKIPVGPGQARVLPVLVMAQAYSRYLSATMLPSRQTGDLLSGMWQLIAGVGRVTKVLVWDREAGIGGTGRPTAAAAAFAGTLATRIVLAPRHDPEFKGIVERGNGYLETSFLPGRSFSSPADFNTQLGDWLDRRANQRTVRAIHGRPVEVLETDYTAMTPLPPIDPPVGLCSRIRLARDYYVRVDANDYSLRPPLTPVAAAAVTTARARSSAVSSSPCSQAMRARCANALRWGRPDGPPLVSAASRRCRSAASRSPVQHSAVPRLPRTTAATISGSDTPHRPRSATSSGMSRYARTA